MVLFMHVKHAHTCTSVHLREGQLYTRYTSSQNAPPGFGNAREMMLSLTQATAFAATAPNAAATGEHNCLIAC